MINSNQLVYMDNSIFDTTSNAIAETKLYNTFQDMQTSNNFIKQSSANITIENIVGKYITEILEEAKRPQVIQVTKPVDDSNPNAVELANRQMNYTITLNSITSKILKAKLFLDLNSDGLFKEKELVANLDINEIVGENDYSLNYTLDNRFVGYLDWKIELARSNGIKTNILGNSKYKPLISKKSIKVLQIMPDSSNINLSTDSNVTTLTQDLVVSQDYNLSIESKTVDQVNMLGQNFKLNGYYDMVIMGFADRYGNKQLNLEMINEIEAFAKTGQSVIFTHDTMTPALTNELPSITGPKLLTQRFRDYVGQAR